MTQKEIEKYATGICGFLVSKNLYDIALILGATVFTIISSNHIEEWKAKSFAALVQERIIQAIEMKYKPETSKNNEP